MSSATPRWYPLLDVMPYAMLAILVVFAVIDRQDDGPALLIDLGLSAVLAGWMLWMHGLHPAWRERPAVMTVFVVGFVGLMAVLVMRDPSFGLLAIPGYHFTFNVLPWPWQLIGISAVAVVAGSAQASQIPKDTLLGITAYAVIVAVNVLAVCFAAWVFWNGNEQSARRQSALDELGEAHRKLEATLAENAGLHAQLLVQAREAGARDERERMAREIHDTLAQGLAGIITQLQAAEQADADQAGRHRHFAAAIGLARESLSEARRSVHALRPEPLEAAAVSETRLGDALAAVTERWSALHGVPATVTTTGEPRPMPPEAEVALLRTAQEALANVAKHARAQRVGLTLSYLAREVALDVRDDGAGFAALPSEATGGTGGGFGLVAMRQRIEGLRGTLQVESEPGGGTAISACIPAGAA